MSRAGAAIFIFFILVFDVVYCFSQDIERYSGEVNFGGEQFDSEFEFYVEGGDTIYHGSFFLNRPLTDHQIEDPFNFLTVEGAFHRGTPDKTWKVSTGDFVVNGKAEYRKYSYIKQVEGIETLTTAYFDRGQRTGTWRIFEWELEASEVKDTLLMAELTFENDLLYGPIKFQDSLHTLSGMIGTEERASGTWNFSKEGEGSPDTGMNQRWIFSDARLTEKIVEQGGVEVRYQIFKDTLTDGESEFVEISPNFFEIVRLTASISNEDIFDPSHFEQGFEDFYAGTVQLILSSDSLLFVAAGKKAALPVMTEVFKFPLSRKERRDLDKAREAAASVRELIELLERDPQINLARISTPEVSWYMGLVHLIDEKYLAPIDEIFHLLDEGVFEFIDRDRYITTRISFGAEIKGEKAMEDSVVKVDYRFQTYEPKDEEAPVKRLRTLAEGLVSELELISDSLELFIFEIRKEEELTGKEGELFERFEGLQVLADSVLTEELDELAGFKLDKAINDFLKSKISEFASLESSTERMRAVDETLDCLDKAENLILVLESSLQNYYATRDAYKRQVFNPYTYTYMEETIKPTIFKSFERVILPGIYQNVKYLSCVNIEDVKLNFSILFDGMNAVLNQDTKRKQRRIKRAADPAEAAEILEFPLIFKD